MRTIKDVYDLAEKLADSVEDRRVTMELLSIQHLVLDIQTEKAKIVDESIARKRENENFVKKLHNSNWKCSF